MRACVCVSNEVEPQKGRYIVGTDRERDHRLCTPLPSPGIDCQEKGERMFYGVCEWIEGGKKMEQKSDRKKEKERERVHVRKEEKSMSMSKRESSE